MNITEESHIHKMSQNGLQMNDACNDVYNEVLRHNEKHQRATHTCQKSRIQSIHRQHKDNAPSLTGKCINKSWKI